MSTEIFNSITIITTMVIGFGTIWFAKSQAESASKQVDIANSTNSDTKKLLEDIKRNVERVELISEKTKSDIEIQINKLIDNQNLQQTSSMNNLTTVLSNFDPKVKQSDAISNAMVQGFLTGDMDIDKVGKLLEMTHKINNLNQK